MDQNFGNRGALSITACKYEDSNGNERGGQFTPVSGWNMTLGDNTQPTGETGCYTFENLTPDTYTVTEASRTGWSSADETEGSQTVTLTSENETLYFYNYRQGIISGYKWEDTNADGQLTCTEGEEASICEDKLSGWTIFLDINGDGILNNEEPSTTTDGDGNYHFDVDPGTYSVCEVVKPGWQQTYPINSEVESLCHTVTVESNGKESGYDFGNQVVTPILTLTKSNNAVGDKAPGSDVLFTLTVTATQNAVNNVVVKDLPSVGFTYRIGSWSAKINGVPFAITEPVYASPGTWNIGNMNVGEVIELQYIADIASGQQSGTYRDLAWATGTDVLANNDTGVFVGTDVSVNSGDNPSTSVNIIREEKNETTGQVLGASTELPATGGNTFWLIVASLMLAAGAGSISAGIHLTKYPKRQRRLHA